jgi:hypothetical protein
MEATGYSETLVYFYQIARDHITKDSNLHIYRCEYLVCRNDFIFSSQAFGIPDPKVGEEICVFLRLRKGATLTEQDVRNYCKDKVSRRVLMLHIKSASVNIARPVFS